MLEPSREQKGCQFTVHTPTYNRQHTLQRVYDSLSVQTFTDFEWLIVDDGSTDETCKLIEGWIRSAPFPIRLIKNQHAGKPAAVMTAVVAASGQWFLVLDSDDACVADALEKFVAYWNRIPADQRAAYIGVTGLSQDQHGQLVGQRFPSDILDSDAIEIKYRYHLQGEKWGFLRTAALRELGWPQLDACEFVPEGVWWTLLAKQYKTRYVNEVLRIYYIEPGADRLMNQVDHRRYATGHAIWHRTILNEEIQWFFYNPIEFIRSTVHYIRFSEYSGSDSRVQLCGLENFLAKCLWFIC